MKKRLVELDVLRGIAFLMVVVQHTIGGYSYSKGISYDSMVLSRAIYIIAQPAVKIFLVLMGMTLIYTYIDKFHWKSFYIKKMKFLLIPYIIFSILDIYLLKDWGKLKNIFGQIVTGNAAYHLWYMGMAIRIYAYFPAIIFITRAVRKKSHAFKRNFLLLYSAAYIFVLENNDDICSFLGKLIFGNPTELQQKFINVSPAAWFLYFVIGVYAILGYRKFKNMALKYGKVIIALYMFVAGTVYCRSINLFGDNFFIYDKFNCEIDVANSILCMMSFYVLSLYIVKKKLLCGFFKFIARYSFPSYLFHIVVLQYFANSIHQTKYFYSSLILLILTVSVTSCIFYIVGFIPFSRYVTGVKENFSFHKKKINGPNNSFIDNYYCQKGNV
ncbi:acyltransferase [uncultured Clostridium sp.]|uniref:acyltransferase n=1 Tax=uncultured Clostridium sp. TaxID=59620 RepID=UPI0025CDB166|nr:acyltransferase [uncultured Clostridium sp.]